ncbi:MAG TPA: TIGR00730 family Rossman fold protein [Candidatus Binatia bacterium]|jgi:hypothetical protein
MADVKGNICVFTGSNPGARPEYAEAAREVGRLLVAHGYGLVYGGGNVGLMAVVADAVLERRGEVIGVIPELLVDKELAHRGLSELRVVKSMHERKAVMAELSDGFIGLPGGIGTMEEFFEVLSWAQLNLHDKPCGLLNVGEYYRHVVRFLDHAVDQSFLKPAHRALLIVEEEPRRLLDRFEEFISARTTKRFARSQT